MGKTLAYAKTLPLEEWRLRVTLHSSCPFCLFTPKMCIFCTQKYSVSTRNSCLETHASYKYTQAYSLSIHSGLFTNNIHEYSGLFIIQVYSPLTEVVNLCLDLHDYLIFKFILIFFTSLPRRDPSLAFGPTC